MEYPEYLARGWYIGSLKELPGRSCRGGPWRGRPWPRPRPCDRSSAAVTRSARGPRRCRDGRRRGSSRGWPGTGGRGIRRPEVSDKVAAWILKRVNDTRRIGAVCTGVYGVAPTGLLNGREVTTHWRFARDLARRFPRLRLDHRKPFVQDGPYYTTTGLNGGVNLSLAMIQEDYGPYVAQSVEEELTLRLTKEDQEELPADPAPLNNHPIDRFSDLVAWVIRNLHADLSVEVLARRTCMCPSHFSKVFKSVFGEPPSDFVQNLRLNEARRRLSKRQKTLRTVAASVGFSSPDSFHRAFERKFGSRPSSYLEDRQQTCVAVSNGSH